MPSFQESERFHADEGLLRCHDRLKPNENPINQTKSSSSSSTGWDYDPNLKYKVPWIEGAKGLADVNMFPKFKGVRELADMHADPGKRCEMGGIAVRATTARPLGVVKDLKEGIFYVANLKTGELFGIGETPDEAKADAKEHDPEMSKPSEQSSLDYF